MALEFVDGKEKEKVRLHVECRTLISMDYVRRRKVDKNVDGGKRRLFAS